MTQAAGCGTLTAQARVQSQVSPCSSRGGHCGGGAGFSPRA